MKMAVKKVYNSVTLKFIYPYLLFSMRWKFPKVLPPEYLPTKQKGIAIALGSTLNSWYVSSLTSNSSYIYSFSKEGKDYRKNPPTIILK